MPSSVVELEKDLKTNNLHGIYVLYGEESYLKEEYLKKIKKSFEVLSLGINYIILDESSISTLISDIETPAFGFEKKLIIIRNSNFFKKDNKAAFKDEFKQFVIDNINLINESVVIVFVEETVHKFDFYKTLDKYAKLIELNELKPIEIKNKLKRICELYHVKVEDNSLQYLIEVAGTNLQNLINEIRKLIEYVGKDGIITKQEIDKLTIQSSDAVIFDLTDSIALKDTNKTLDILNNLIYNKEPIQKIVITLYNHIKKLYYTKLAINDNKNISEALSLKVNQLFLIDKYKKQSAAFMDEELKSLLFKLIELDKDSKKGIIDIEIGLKSIICLKK